MRVAQINRIHELPGELEPLEGALKLISFDIFDTLIARRVEPPELVHGRIAELVSRHLGRSRSTAEVALFRNQAEHALRMDATADGLDHECHFDDLVSAWVEKLVGHKDTELVAFIRDHETNLEIDALVPKDGVVEVLTALSEAGKKILAVSDMYLPLDVLERVLEAKGIRHFFDRIYISSEDRVAKHSGRLFQKVLDDYQCPPERMLHVGDNRHSDFNVPGSMGIKAIHLYDKEDARRRHLLASYERMARSTPYWRGRYLLDITHSFEKSMPTGEGFYFRYGSDVLGPLFAATTLGMLERLQKLKVDRVFFLARDGYLFQQIHGLLLSELEEFTDLRGVQTEYVSLSRKTVAAASVVDGLDLERARVGLLHQGQRGLKSILDIYSLPVTEFEPLAKEHGLDPIDQPLRNRNDVRLKSFLADSRVQEKIAALGREKRDQLEIYLDQVGFFAAKRLALIDIGWNGTIQHALGMGFSARADFPSLFGLYFAYCQGIPYAFEGRQHIEGIMYDERRKNPGERACIHFEELFEEAARAGHGSTIGYRLDPDSGEMLPLYKDDNRPDRIEEIRCNPVVAELQAGIMEFTGRFASALRLTGYGFADLHPYMITLMERAVAYPRKEEAVQIGHLTHSDDFGLDTVMDFTEMHGLGPSPLKWRSFRKSLTQSNWRHGALTGTWWGIPRFVFRLSQLARRP